jgi:hypothetical protein
MTGRRFYAFRGKHVTQALRRFEIECAKDGVDDSKRCEYFALEVEPSLWDQVTSLQSFKNKDWTAFVKDMTELFIDEDELAHYLPSDLEDLLQQTKEDGRPSTYSAIMEYKREFCKISEHLVAKSLITKTEEARLFLDGLDNRVKALLEQNAASKAVAEKVMADKLADIKQLSPEDVKRLSTMQPPTLREIMIDVRSIFEATHAYSGGRLNDFMSSRLKLSRAQGRTVHDGEGRYLDRDEDREDPARRRNRAVRFDDAHDRGYDSKREGPSRGERESDSDSLKELTRQMKQLSMALGQVNNAGAPPTRRYDDRPTSRDERQHDPKRIWTPRDESQQRERARSPATYPNNAPLGSDRRTCIFCGDASHLKRECPELKEFIRSGDLLDDGRVRWASSGEEVPVKTAQGTMAEQVRVKKDLQKKESAFVLNTMGLDYTPPALRPPPLEVYRVHFEADLEEDEDHQYDVDGVKRDRPTSLEEGEIREKRPRQLDAEEEEAVRRYETRRDRPEPLAPGTNRTDKPRNVSDNFWSFFTVKNLSAPRFARAPLLPCPQDPVPGS